jgi:hypothetical protein
VPLTAPVARGDHWALALPLSEHIRLPKLPRTAMIPRPRLMIFGAVDRDPFTDEPLFFLVEPKLYRSLLTIALFLGLDVGSEAPVRLWRNALREPLVRRDVKQQATAVGAYAQFATARTRCPTITGLRLRPPRDPSPGRRSFAPQVIREPSSSAR